MEYERERRESDASARSEARSIVQAMKQGVDFTEELAISERTQEILDRFCVDNPREASLVRNALQHRARVRNYVDAILAGEEIHAPETDDEEDILASCPIAEASEPSIQGAQEHVAQEAQA